MSTNRKILKVLSIIGVVLSVLSLIIGGILIATCVSNPDGVVSAMGGYQHLLDLSDVEAVEVLIGCGVALMIYSIFEIFVSAMGIRGANNPSKMGFVFVMATISAAISVLGFILTVANGNFSFGELISVALTCAICYVCFKVREEGKQEA